MSGQAAAIDPREDWLQRRRSGIGGSDAPVVMGVSRRKSAYALWTEKAGLVDPDLTDNEVLRWGRILEGPIADDYQRITGRKVIDLGPHAIQRHPKREWQICTHDRLIEAIDDRGAGVLSVKYMNPIANQDWEETWVERGGPIDYKVQTQHEMSVSGLRWGSFAVLIWGVGVRWCDFELNANFEEALVEEEHDFWRRVQVGDPPPVDGSESTREALKRLYPQDNGKAVDLPAEAEGWIAEIKALSDKEGEAKSRRKHLENLLKAALGPALEGRLNGRVVCTFKSSNRKGYTVEPTVTRTLRLKGDK